MNKENKFHFHRWSEWSKPVLYWYIMYEQEKTCLICGKTKTKIIIINVPPGSYK